MPRLYDSTPSGNCYKVRLLLAQLGIRYERVPIDVTGGGPRPAELLRDNPLGKVPKLELDDGRALVESGAILWDVADGTPFLPGDKPQRTEVLRWLLFEQNAHEPNIAVARFLTQYRDPAGFREVLAFLERRGRLALDAMERHLERVPYFVGARYTIADIALYAYTHVAGEGGFDLAPYPRIRAWLGRVREQPGHVAMGS